MSPRKSGLYLTPETHTCTAHAQPHTCVRAYSCADTHHRTTHPGSHTCTHRLTSSPPARAFTPAARAHTHVHTEPRLSPDWGHCASLPDRRPHPPTSASLLVLSDSRLQVCPSACTGRSGPPLFLTKLYIQTQQSAAHLRGLRSTCQWAGDRRAAQPGRGVTSGLGASPHIVLGGSGKVCVRTV